MKNEEQIYFNICQYLVNKTSIDRICSLIYYSLISHTSTTNNEILGYYTGKSQRFGYNIDIRLNDLADKEKLIIYI